MPFLHQRQDVDSHKARLEVEGVRSRQEARPYSPCYPCPWPSLAVYDGLAGFNVSVTHPRDRQRREAIASLEPKIVATQMKRTRSIERRKETSEHTGTSNTDPSPRATTGARRFHRLTSGSQFLLTCTTRYGIIGSPDHDAAAMGVQLHTARYSWLMCFVQFISSYPLR